MARRLDDRLRRVEAVRQAREHAHDRLAVEHRALLRARSATGAIVRDALGRAGIDPACVWALRLADAAATELADVPDSAALRAADNQNLDRGGDAKVDNASETFNAKILDLMARYADGRDPDRGRASLMEWFAWSLAGWEQGRFRAD